ncbi:MAG TPA: haloacid dehalogenase [Anaerolineales bacterium]|jgi:translin
MAESSTLESIVEDIRQGFEAKNAVRDQALRQSRTLIRHCSTAIRAVHRDEWQAADDELEQAKRLVDGLRQDLEPHPDLYYAGYTQDGLKEYAEANLVRAIVASQPMPTPQTLDVEPAAYLAGMAEAAGELRRRVLDILRADRYEEAERLLAQMDEIYGLLVTIDFPDAITQGLRRLTDMVRGVTERTRGDLTTSWQQHRLRGALKRAEERDAGA